MDSGGAGASDSAGADIGGAGLGGNVEPDTGGLGGGLGGAIGGPASGLGGGMPDITAAGSATSTATGAGGFGDITASPSGGGFLDQVASAIANFDYSGALGGFLGGIVGGFGGPVGAIAGSLAGRTAGDYIGSQMGIQSAQAGLNNIEAIGQDISGALGGLNGSGAAPQAGGGGRGESALLPSSNAAIALGVPTGTPTQNVAQSLGVGS